jgi:hypothetical protein
VKNPLFNRRPVDRRAHVVFNTDDHLIRSFVLTLYLAGKYNDNIYPGASRLGTVDAATVAPAEAGVVPAFPAL